MKINFECYANLLYSEKDTERFSLFKTSHNSILNLLSSSEEPFGMGKGKIRTASSSALG